MRPFVLACIAFMLACGNGDDEMSASSHGDSDNVDFGCGSMLHCSADDEYCEVVLGPDMLPASYHCVPLPMECGSSPKCECLEMTTCGQCEMSPEGGLTSSCMPE